MSKENENLNEAENSALNIADVGGVFFLLLDPRNVTINSRNVTIN